MTIPFLPTPEAAEYAFYSAFESADPDAMMAVWETSEAIVCIHPLGPPLQGCAQIRESWRQIFGSGTRLRFRLSGIRSVVQEGLAIRIVYEHITVLGAEEQPAQPVIATNVYRRTPYGWRMILHHASPAPTAMTEQPPDHQPRRVH